jgi:hypothetical protein
MVASSIYRRRWKPGSRGISHRPINGPWRWGLTEAPLLVPKLLKLIDESCKSKQDARLAKVVLDVIRAELSWGTPGQKPR